LLFELVSRRYEAHSTIITTDEPFEEWTDVFPNAACVVSLVDRLVHRAEVISIEGESYRLKEARERSEAQARQRKTRQPSHEDGDRVMNPCCHRAAVADCRSPFPTTGRLSRHSPCSNCSRICSPS
jgi:hypothetical protein